MLNCFEMVPNTPFFSFQIHLSASLFTPVASAGLNVFSQPPRLELLQKTIGSDTFEAPGSPVTPCPYADFLFFFLFLWLSILSPGLPTYYDSYHFSLAVFRMRASMYSLLPLCPFRKTFFESPLVSNLGPVMLV